MTPYVVDTNVAIAANGRNTHVDPECQLACVEKLEDVCRWQVVVVDDGGLIFDEYKGNLNFAGAPGMGDTFFKHLFDHSYDENRVRRVSITPCSDDRLGFKELPENGLDKSDRKFLAAALVAQATILNATDSDWSQQEALTKCLGVTVKQLCPQHASRSSP